MAQGLFQELRAAGESDDDILDFLAETAPDHAPAISELRKAGEPSKDILDFLGERGVSQKQEDPSWVPGMDNVRQGLSQPAVGLGKTIKQFGPEWAQGAGDALEGWGRRTAPDPTKFKKHGELFDPFSLSSYKYLPGTIVESAPRLGLDAVAGAVGALAPIPGSGPAAFIAMDAAQTSGDKLEQRMANQAPGAEPSLTDKGVAVGSAVVEGGLNRLGLAPLSAPVKGAGVEALKHIPGQVVKTMGTEGAAGAASSAVDQAGRFIGTEKGAENFDPKQGLREVAGGAVGGAVLGGGAAATKGVVRDVPGAIKFSGGDADAKTRVADRISKNEFAPGNQTRDFKAVETVQKQIDDNIKEQVSDLKGVLREEGSLRTLNEIQAAIDEGGTLTKRQMQRLEDSLGNIEETQPLLGLLKERVEVNRLKTKGNWDANEKTFAGGVSGSNIGRNLSPIRLLRKMGMAGAGLGATAGAGVMGLPMGAQMLSMATGVAKPVLGAMAGASLGARALDGATGFRSPTKAFTDRFKGRKTSETPKAARSLARESHIRQSIDELHKQQSQTKAVNDAQSRKDLALNSKRNGELLKRAHAFGKQEASTRKRDARAAEIAANEALMKTHRQGTDEAKLREKTAKVQAAEAETAMKQTIARGKEQRKADLALETKAWGENKRFDADNKRAAQEANREYEGARREATRQNDELTAKAAEAKRKQEIEKKLNDKRKAAGEKADQQIPVSVKMMARDVMKKARAEQQARENPKPEKPVKEPKPPKAEKPKPEPKEDTSLPLSVKLKARELLRGIKARDKAAAKPEKPAAKEPKAEKPAKEPSEKVKKSKKAQQDNVEVKDADGVERIRISARGYSVDRPTKDIDYMDAYIAATERNLEVRADLADSLKAVLTDKSNHKKVDALVEGMNNRSKSYRDAEMLASEIFNEFPDAKVNASWDVWNEFMDKIQGTYEKKAR